MAKYIYWSKETICDWSFTIIYPPIVEETNHIIKEKFRDGNFLFLNFLFDNNFQKKFSKLGIKHSEYTHKNKKTKFASISSHDIDAFNDVGKFYEHSYIEISKSLSKEKIHNIPDLNYSESLHFGEDKKVISILDSLESSFLFTQNDGREIRLFSRHGDLTNNYLIELFRFHIKNLDIEIKNKFSDQIILKIAYFCKNTNEISDNIIIDSTGLVKFQLWNSKIIDRGPKLEEFIQVCNVCINNDEITFSEWGKVSSSELPSNIANRKAGKSCLTFMVGILLIIICLYYLIKFLIGLF